MFEDVQNLVTKKYVENFNSLRENTWSQILDHAWLSKDLTESWQVPEKSLIRCQRTCAIEASPILSQSSDVQL